jgi:hypothetical protein
MRLGSAPVRLFSGVTRPLDRDRGLRIVGVVTVAVAVVSLLGIVATTALAAAQTRHQDELTAPTTRSAPATAP